MSRATPSSDTPATRSSRSKSRHPPSSADATENQHPSASARKKTRKELGTSNGFLNPFASASTPSPLRVSVSNSDSVPIRYGYTPHKSPELDAQTYPRVNFSQTTLSRGAPNLHSSSPPQFPHASSSSVADDLSNTFPIIDPLLCNPTESPILAPRSPQPHPGDGAQILSFLAPTAQSTRPRRGANSTAASVPTPLLPAFDFLRPSKAPMSPSSTPHLSSTASYPTPSTVVTSSGLVQTTQPIRLPPLIPKAITDKLVYQQSQMEEMQRQMQRQDDTIESLRNTVDDLSNSRDDFFFEMKDLDAENIHLLQRVDVLENLVRKQTKKIDQLFEMLEDSEPHERTKRDEDSKPKATRDNVLNSAVRKTLFVAMGLPKTSKVKDAAAIRSNKAGGGYIKDKETGGRLLRPDWETTFQENSTWHAKMLEYVRQQAPHHNPALTLAAMNAKSDDELLDRLSSLFKNIAAESRKIAKLGGEADDEGLAANEKQEGRRKTRKVRKCDERIKVLSKAGYTLPDEYMFLLQWQYQSTDESDISDVIDPDTETEESNEIPASSTRKPWKSRPPTYRSEGMQNGVDKLEAMVMKYRQEEQKNNKGKTFAHPRLPGDWKDIRLPWIGAGKPNKIPRSAIDPEWLERNPDDDTPSRIQAPEDSSRAAEGDDAEEMAVDAP
ncbi:hypothetical protein B0H13DRAFT_2398327 [Mycena leptocephala]|nr:hypothetical protein B0H13DRAFT_2398327 [Mycena leptocephala]